jgi:hypothetical protein
MHLRVKEREKRVGSAHIEDTQRLVTEEIEMLRVVLQLVASTSRKKIEGAYHCLRLCYISRGRGGSVIVFIGASTHPAREQCLNY